MNDFNMPDFANELLARPVTPPKGSAMPDEIPFATDAVPSCPQNDDVMWTWLVWAHETGGLFVQAIAGAAIVADPENYRLMRPLLLRLKAKYPSYAQTPQPVVVTPAAAEHDRQDQQAEKEDAH